MRGRRCGSCSAARVTWRGSGRPWSWVSARSSSEGAATSARLGPSTWSMLSTWSCAPCTPSPAAPSTGSSWTGNRTSSRGRTSGRRSSAPPTRRTRSPRPCEAASTRAGKAWASLASRTWARTSCTAPRAPSRPSWSAGTGCRSRRGRTASARCCWREGCRRPACTSGRPTRWCSTGAGPHPSSTSSRTATRRSAWTSRWSW
mmetsp:Transcript_52066/g.161564  ORF Transcript_52066/g.161564 Transcript_52066/m.161564 type:complete len:202 (+) Transcript_52066:661-1266(+)